MKKYAKDLTPEEVIERLERGEILNSANSGTIEFVSGFTVGKRNGQWIINAQIGSYAIDDFYFDMPEPEMQIEVGKFYITRGDDKAYVFAKNSEGKFNIAVEGGEAYAVFPNGCYSEDEDSDKDLVKPFEKKSEKKETKDKLTRVKEMLAKKYSYADIAKELDTSIGAIASYIYYNRNKGKL